MSNLVIREATALDIDTIAELERLCFPTPWSRDSIRQELTENKLAFYVVAELNGRVTGYMGMWHILDEGHITNVAVHPDYRDKRIGSALVAVVLSYSETRGIRRFTLEVRSSNEAAKALYRKFGFKEEGLRRGYYKDNGEDAVIMWRDPTEPLKN